MSRFYRSLLCLYPAGYRREFGDEMAFVFHEQRNNLAGGVRSRVSFCLQEITGLMCGAVREHLHILIGSEYWNYSRRSNMRRFPLSTILLMIAILAGVMLSIKAAKDIVAVQMNYDPRSVTVWGTFPAFFTICFALVCLMAVSGWAVLFALRRSGIHRLSNVQTWPEER